MWFVHPGKPWASSDSVKIPNTARKINVGVYIRVSNICSNKLEKCSEVIIVMGKKGKTRENTRSTSCIKIHQRVAISDCFTQCEPLSALWILARMSDLFFLFQIACF